MTAARTQALESDKLKVIGCLELPHDRGAGGLLRRGIDETRSKKVRHLPYDKKAGEAVHTAYCKQGIADTDEPATDEPATSEPGTIELGTEEPATEAAITLPRAS